MKTVQVVQSGSGRTEGQLRDSILLEQVLEQSGEAVIVKNLDAVVTYWNREAASLYGFTADEALGKPLRKLHAADLSEADYAKLLERIRSGKRTASTTDRRKKSGESVRVALKTAPLHDAHGKLVGEITIARDITTLHRAEEALRAAQATLEARLAAMKEANRTLNHEIVARRKTEQEVRRNQRAMAATIRLMERFHRDEEALSGMAELLQCCADRAEAYAIIAGTVAKLFPETAGHLYIYRESRDVLEKAASWGAAQPAESSLAPQECWALRLGKPHQAGRGAGMRCLHARRSARPCACLPVQGQGQILGLLHILVEHADRDGNVARRLRSLTDAIGPALANLRLRDALRELALRDTLTGLYNRRYLEDAIVRELHRAERSGKPVAVIMIDIDHFKRFNDKHGHDAGDFVLGAVARAISANVRPSDMACRYGGEELAVVMPDASLQVACARAEKLRLAVRATNLTHLGQSLPAPSASFGVAVFPAHGAKPAELFRAADRALYEAKQLGRDRVCVAPDATGQGQAAVDDRSATAG